MRQKYNLFGVGIYKEIYDRISDQITIGNADQWIDLIKQFENVIYLNLEKGFSDRLLDKKIKFNGSAWLPQYSILELRTQTPTLTMDFNKRQNFKGIIMGIFPRYLIQFPESDHTQLSSTIPYQI